MDTTKNNEKALLFLGLAINYLSLVENILGETIKYENEHIVLFDHKSLPGEYEDRTKWSDFNIIIPTLYDFYHGLELLMKGLIFLLEEEPSLDHDIEKLFIRIKSNEKINSIIKDSLIEHIDRNKLYSWNITDFLEENNLSINEMYQAFRYPIDTRFKKIREYYHLHYRENDAIPYFNKIIEDSKKLRRECVQLYRQIISDREI